MTQSSPLAYQKELEVKQRQTKELEESTLNLDEQAKRLHKQFKLNRENYERYVCLLLEKVELKGTLMRNKGDHVYVTYLRGGISLGLRLGLCMLTAYHVCENTTYPSRYTVFR